MAPPAEIAALLALARPSGGPFHCAQATQFSWPRLLTLADAHGLKPLLLRQLTEDPPASLPPELLESVTDEYFGHLGRNLNLGRRLFEILDLLAAAGIEARPFKGPVLSQMLYDDYGLRDCDDLDLLVRRSDAPAARRALSGAGFDSEDEPDDGGDAFLGRFRKHFVFTHPDDDFALELHWTFSDRYQPFDLDAEAVWPRRNAVDFAGRTAHTLAPEDLLPMLCVHTYRHGWMRLEHVLQIAEAARRFESRLAGLGERCDRLRVRRLTAVSLQLADRLYGEPAAARLLGGFPPDPHVEPIAARIAERLCSDRPNPTDWETLVLNWRTRERWADRLRFLAWHPRTLSPAARRMVGGLGRRLLGWGFDQG